jgi:selenoprotein W-related protein
LPRASGLEAELVEAFDADVEIIRGSGGVYDVVVDGGLIFSKKSEGRFPDAGEIVGLIRKK